MLHDALEHLMEDIGSDGNEYIAEWKVFPEWVKDRLYARLTTCCMKGVNLSIRQQKGFECFVVIAQWEPNIFSKLISGGYAFWALAGVCARDQ